MDNERLNRITHAAALASVAKRRKLREIMLGEKLTPLRIPTTASSPSADAPEAPAATSSAAPAPEKK